MPLDWATTQNNLGAALRTLGERESGTARLKEAVAAYRAASEVAEQASHQQLQTEVRNGLAQPNGSSASAGLSYKLCRTAARIATG